MGITVYSKRHCPQCDATKRRLDRLGIHYVVVDVDDDPDTAGRLAGEGYRQTPVVKADGGEWSGYRPDLIDGLAKTADV